MAMALPLVAPLNPLWWWSSSSQEAEDEASEEAVDILNGRDSIPSESESGETFSISSFSSVERL